MNLINAENTDGTAYRENLAKLYGSLLNAAITTQGLLSYGICFAAALLTVIFHRMSQQMEYINMPVKYCVHH